MRSKFFLQGVLGCIVSLSIVAGGNADNLKEDARFPQNSIIGFEHDHKEKRASGFFCKLDRETSAFDFYHASDMVNPIERGFSSSDMCISGVSEW